MAIARYSPKRLIHRPDEPAGVSEGCWNASSLTRLVHQPDKPAGVGYVTRLNGRNEGCTLRYHSVWASGQRLGPSTVARTVSGYELEWKRNASWLLNLVAVCSC